MALLWRRSFLHSNNIRSLPVAVSLLSASAAYNKVGIGAWGTSINEHTLQGGFR